MTATRDASRGLPIVRTALTKRVTRAVLTDPIDAELPLMSDEVVTVDRGSAARIARSASADPAATTVHIAG